jgi:hypothetical protein
MDVLVGILLVAIGGLIMGAGAWPMKLMRTFAFEHWWFLGVLFGLVLSPWTITIVLFPQTFTALQDPAVQKALLIANVLALAWGVANILCGLCLVRIGFALTQAILTGLGVSVVVVTPMVFKGSGQFKDAPDLGTAAGATVLVGVVAMLIAVVLAAMAGFGRDRELKKLQQTSGSFSVGLIMAVIAGVTSAGLWLAFVYCQGPIRSRVSVVQTGEQIDLSVTADQRLCGKFAIGRDGAVVVRGAENGGPCSDDAAKKIAKAFSGSYTIDKDGALALRSSVDGRTSPVAGGPIAVAGISAKEAAERVAEVIGVPEKVEADRKVTLTTQNIWSVFPVWATGAFSGAMLNLIYPAFLMTRRRSWGVLLTNWKEFGLTLIMGFQTLLALSMPAKGMLLLGALGASIGCGIQQAMQMVGGQGTGFISGEWRGVHGTPRRQMYLAIALLIIAAIIMAYSKTLAN